jgi:CheY-like chemotaxis protein
MVDDIETSRNLTAGVLRKQGYTVALADGGEHALKLTQD